MKDIFPTPSTGRAPSPWLPFFLAIILFFVFPAPGRVSASASPLEFGRQQFEHGEYEKAYRTFFSLFQQNPADLDINYNLGRAAYEKGDYEAAVMAFERILIAVPDNTAVKLEMAKSYLRLGARENAAFYFRQVLAADLSEDTRKNLQSFVNSMNAEQDATVPAGPDRLLKGAP